MSEKRSTETTPMTDGDTMRVERIWELDEAVRQIARMKVFPDDKINRVTLVAAIEIARSVLLLHDNRRPDPLRRYPLTAGVRNWSDADA